MPRNEGNVLLEMGKNHFGSVETPAIEGMHQSLNDVSSAILPYGRGDDGVCPGFYLKAIITDLLRFFELPDHQLIAGGRVYQHDSGS